jgi:hypothetical protein
MSVAVSTIVVAVAVCGADQGEGLMAVITWLTGALGPEVVKQMNESARSPYNHGSSLGLQYPWVFGCVHGHWEVWCRYCNVLYSFHEDDNPIFAEAAASRACHEANGLSEWPSQDVISAMDTTP